MGSGSKKKHEVYSVGTAPDVAGVVETVDAVAPAAPEIGSSVSSLAALGVGGIALGVVPQAGMDAFAAAGEALSAFLATAATLHGPDDFDAFVEAFSIAKEAVEAAKEAGAGVQQVEMLSDELRAAAKSFLAGIAPSDLVWLAGSHGFEHPGLIGLHTPEGKVHPLAHWLDPTYGPETTSKLKLQEKALERWAVLTGGGSIEGMDLAGYLALHPDEAVQPAAEETLTPEQLDELIASLQELDEQIKGLSGEERARARFDRCRTAMAYALATCSDPTYEKLTLGPSVLTRSDAELLKPYLEAEFGLSALDVDLIASTGTSFTYGSTAIVTHLFGTGEAKATISEAVVAKKEQIAALGPLAPSVLLATASLAANPTSTVPLDLPPLSWTDTDPEAALLAFLGNFGPARKAALALGPVMFTPAVKAAIWPDGPDAIVTKLNVLHPGGVNAYSFAKNLPKAFRLWAKAQSLGLLRQAAVATGGPSALEAKKLTRAQVTNFLLGKINAKAQHSYEASIAAPAPAPAPASGAAFSPKPASPPAPAMTAAPPPTPGGIMMPKETSFAQKRAKIAAGLQHLAAALAALPDRPSAAEVASLTFTSSAAPLSGGAHSKSFFVDAEKGRTWMYKPDKTGGARALVEATAAELLHRIGLPAVPVYRQSLANSTGCIQPIVAAAKTLPPNPSSWSQGDVDSIVRYHVANWMLGDHDGNNENVIRTPQGGLIAVDHGQAWKFVGDDRLALDYHPNSSFGTAPPVYHRAYSAAAEGKLGDGVEIHPEAATPVIAAFEAMPDDEFRKMISPVADAGAKANLTWVPAMTKEAKKRFGATSPSTAQIAEAFVEHLVDRKHRLRDDFKTFFAGLGITGSHLLEQVA